MSSLVKRLSSERARFMAFCAFLIAVFLLGGASREDVPQLILLRPIAILAGCYALWQISVSEARSVLFPLAMLCCLSFVMILQLIPIPIGWWEALPDRQAYAQLYKILGLETGFRPLTISPAATLNSLFSLAIPMTAILLFAIQPEPNRYRATLFMWGLCAASIFWAILQISIPVGESLYFFSVTNNGMAVGFFSNRNHNAVLAAMLLTATIWYLSTIDNRDKSYQLKLVLCFGVALLLLFFSFVAASRAGLVVTAISLLSSYYFVRRSPFVIRLALSNGQREKASWIKGNALWVGYVALIGCAVLLLVFLERSDALDRLLKGDVATEVRGQLLPVLWEMIKNQFVYGAGFGAFEHVYPHYEPESLIGPSYLNEAHNDLAQFVIEGGSFAIVLLVLYVLWYVRSAVRILASGYGSMKHAVETTSIEKPLVVVALLSIAQLGLASAVDYPLRTPIMMTVLAISCAIVAARTAANDVAHKRKETIRSRKKQASRLLVF